MSEYSLAAAGGYSLKGGIKPSPGRTSPSPPAARASSSASVAVAAAAAAAAEAASGTGGATSKVRPSGDMADLNTVACSGTMPETRMVGSSGSMRERCSVRSEERAPRGGSSIARSRAMRFGRDSPLAFRACAALESDASNASSLRSEARR
eukprot:scaffold27877_cov63-Phaeocystis_antarctica.AAC.1